MERSGSGMHGFRRRSRISACGILEYQIEDKPPVMYQAGDVLFIPGGTVYAARSVGGVPGTELATYIVEKAKPLVVLVN